MQELLVKEAREAVKDTSLATDSVVYTQTLVSTTSTLIVYHFLDIGKLGIYICITFKRQLRLNV